MVGNTDLNCEGLHGPIAMDEAIVKSCNIYFYRIGKLLEYDNLLDWAEHFGFGRTTGVLDRDLYGMEGRYTNIPLEAAGKLKQSDPGTANLMRFAIGQGAIDDVTTMQVARMAAGIATGRLPQPHLISRIGTRDFEPPPPEDLGVSRRTLDFVRQAMKEVVTRGTARPDPAHNLDLTLFHVAGKTGTPQTKPSRPDHASFAGFWPFQKPRYSFAVFVEDCDIHGGDIAAPVLNRILESEEARRYVEKDP
jgi:penicillin-binding protein 2